MRMRDGRVSGLLWTFFDHIQVIIGKDSGCVTFRLIVSHNLITYFGIAF